MHPFTLHARRALVVAIAAASALALCPTTAGAAGNPSFEVATIRAVTPSIAATVAALEAGDLPAARQAEQDYNILWHGVEVYLNVRSKPAYDVLEGDIQHRLETELAKADASAPVALGIARELRAEYDEVVALIEKGPPISPLFDDIQVLRLNRAYLAQGAIAELNAGNLVQARAFWSYFASGYPATRAVVAVRNANVADELDAAFQAAHPAFADQTTTLDTLKALAGVVNTKLGVGLNLLNAAARNAKLDRGPLTVFDGFPLVSLNQVRVAVNRSADAWRAGQFATAGTAAATAAGGAYAGLAAHFTAWGVTDVTLTTALTSFATLAGTAGDAARFETAYTAAVNAILITQQVFVGQFWSDARLQQFVASLPAR
jgi:hypothetical protein